MTPKEWLVKNCPLKKDKSHKCVKPNQRGRLSLEHHKVLSSLPAGTLASYEAGTAVNKDGQTRSVNKSPAQTNEKVVHELAFRYDESKFKAVEIDSGKERSMRAACNICRYSLVGCFCDHPRIVATGNRKETSVLVKVVPK